MDNCPSDIHENWCSVNIDEITIYKTRNPYVAYFHGFRWGSLGLGYSQYFKFAYTNCHFG